VDQNNNNSQNEFLWTLLANPANDAHSYTYNLQQLVNEFPQSGILQALLAHAGGEKNLRQASVYFDAKLLYKLINAPSTINNVPDEKIIIHAPISTNGQYQHTDHEPEIEHAEGQLSSTAITDEPHLTETVEGAEESVTVEEPAESEAAEVQETVINDTETTQPEPELAPTVENEEPAEAGIENHIEETPHPALSKGEDSEEEILSITDQKVLSFGEDLGEANRAAPDPALSTGEVSEEETLSITVQEAPSFVQGTPSEEEDLGEPTPVIAEEVPVVESIEQQPEERIADTETFDEIVDIEVISTAQDTIQPAASAQEEETITDEKSASEAVEEENPITENIASTDHRNVSKYNDEKMPYTFMWWLDKTRKEHAGVHQPYINPSPVASNVKPKMAADELQQQYFENIFHITSLDELDKGIASRTVPFDMKRKEHVIIERFIKEEPQIKPQSSDKLDNENKAKKSSEDRDELVTETLAGIYSEQMLYHKAIASYKKLMLKFPEKSRYFAAKIEQLEKKIN
jgi:hypothetical protein